MANLITAELRNSLRLCKVYEGTSQLFYQVAKLTRRIKQVGYSSLDKELEAELRTYLEEVRNK